MLNRDIILEATRLTRSGEIVEATALLQRMLRGENAPNATTPTTGDPVLLLQEESRRPSTPRRTPPTRGVRDARPGRRWTSP